MQPGEAILPGQTREFKVDPGCYHGNAVGQHGGLTAVATFGLPQIAFSYHFETVKPRQRVEINANGVDYIDGAS
ncbi:MAG: hypothetical protein AAF092_05280 [Pseudomonadota bacterium]